MCVEPRCIDADGSGDITLDEFVSFSLQVGCCLSVINCRASCYRDRGTTFRNDCLESPHGEKTKLDFHNLSHDPGHTVQTQRSVLRHVPANQHLSKALTRQLSSGTIPNLKARFPYTPSPTQALQKTQTPEPYTLQGMAA